MSAARKGLKKSPEHRALMSAVMKHPKSPETISKARDTRLANYLAKHAQVA
jgi:hypothetical protein